MNYTRLQFFLLFFKYTPLLCFIVFGVITVGRIMQFLRSGETIHPPYSTIYYPDDHGLSNK